MSIFFKWVGEKPPTSFFFTHWWIISLKKNVFATSTFEIAEMLTQKRENHGDFSVWGMEKMRLKDPEALEVKDH